MVRGKHVSFIDNYHWQSASFGDFAGQGVGGLGDEGGVVEVGYAAEGGHDRLEITSRAEVWVGKVYEVVAGGVQAGNGGAGGHGLASADSEGDRLQQLRAVLPCVIEVTDPAHPLFGERLKAVNFQRRKGLLRLVVVLPDGTPGMVPAGATGVFGVMEALGGAMTTLSVDGVRRLRAAVDRATGSTLPAARRGRAKTWRVVRHAPGADPFEELEWVYSAHTTPAAAQRARDKVRATLARSSGEAEAARWAWTVVHDLRGAPANKPQSRESFGTGDAR